MFFSKLPPEGLLPVTERCIIELISIFPVVTSTANVIQPCLSVSVYMCMCTICSTTFGFLNSSESVLYLGTLLGWSLCFYYRAIGRLLSYS